MATLHLYNIKNVDKFEDIAVEDNQIVSADVNILIPSMNQVVFNGEQLNTIMDEKATKTDLTNAISDKVTKTELNDIMPSYSIIQYGGNVIPQGWQLCDGARLTYKDKSSTARDRFVEDNDGKDINTPSLYNIQLFNPASTQVFFNSNRSKDIPQDGTVHYEWNQSSLFSYKGWYANDGNYMRINLKDIYEIVGIVLAGRGDSNTDSYYYMPKTFEAYVSNITDPNLLNNYLGSAYSTPNLPVEYCKVNNNQNILKPTLTNNYFRDKIMFDKGIKGNFFTIKLLNSTKYGRFIVRLALLVKPSTKSIIKQPLSTDSF